MVDFLKFSNNNYYIGLDVEFICEKEGVYNDIQNYKQIIDSGNK